MERYKKAYEKNFHEDAFWQTIDSSVAALMEEGEHFYSYFLFQVQREIQWELTSPTGSYFKGAKYHIAFNPLFFEALTKEQIATTLKHEIHHIIALHMLRGQRLKEMYSTLAINLGMDSVVNQYLEHLPPYATTLPKINRKYGLNLQPFEALEYYVEKIQEALDLQEEDEEGETQDEDFEGVVYDEATTHDLWEQTEQLDDKTIYTFTEQLIESARKGSVPEYLESLLQSLAANKPEVPWQIYLQKMMGTIESDFKKTLTRRSRRQPERLDLRGTLRRHKAEVAVAFDISGSISDEAFKQGMEEVLHLVKRYKCKLTVIECDDAVRRTYPVGKIGDLQQRLGKQGATRYSPVFEYANKHKLQLLVYFTDGKGETKLEVRPKGYKVLWILTGEGEGLSLTKPYGVVKRLKKVEIKEKSLDMSDVRQDGYSMNHQEPTL